MTLITYPVRAHFADGVLEEALRSELETHRFRAPLIIAQACEVGSEFSERLFAGLPRGCEPAQYFIPEGTSKTQAAVAVRALAQEKPPDVLIAYGSARAIGYGRKCRHVLQADRGGAPMIDLFAIPGVDGLPGPCRERRAGEDVPSDLVVRTGLPSILICDPTVTIDASPESFAKAASKTLVQCLEAYLSAAFNPPADGMALDGLERTVRLLPRLADNSVEMRRDLMAACFNATLCQQKGVGPAQVIGDALHNTSAGDLDGDAAAGIVLPGVLRSLTCDPGKCEIVGKVLNIQASVDLPDGVARLMQSQHGPRSLSELGATRAGLRRAADDLSDRFEFLDRCGTDDVMQIMEAVF